MRTIITEKDLRDMIKRGEDPNRIPADALLTPSARDFLATVPASVKPGAKTVSAAAVEPVIPDYEYHWKPGADPKTPQDIQRFFNSPEIQQLKKRMCDIGRRIWEKDYVDGNGGNLTVRVGDNLVLCTPTLISKGFMKPEDICLVDIDGNQLAGTLKRTSEVNTHLGIMKRQPKAKSCVHAHPPHATAFAVASVKPPTCMIPEAEVFLGEIGLAPYETPGTPENARVVGEMGINHQSIIMENHGVITWGKDIEDAYWKMENTDAYCKTIWVASQLGNGLKTFGTDKLHDLIRIRQSLGMDDKRADLKECELCDNIEFRPGVTCSVPGAPVSGSNGSSIAASDPEAEEMVRAITEMIEKEMRR